MPPKKIDSHKKPEPVSSRFCTEAQLMSLAQDLALRLEPRSVVLLEGELGAGKTTFVRAMLRARNITQAVTSPSFSIIQEYIDGLDSSRRWVHVDLFRIKSEADIADLGLDSLVGAPQTVVCIEWISLFPQWNAKLQERGIAGHKITLKIVDSEKREIEIGRF